MPAESTAISITLNQQIVETGNATLQQVLAEHGWQQGRFVVVVNDNIVPKASHSTFQLTAGDCIDVLSPISGG